MWRESNFGPGVTISFFLLFFRVSVMTCPELSGDPIASCRLWAEKTQCSQPGPALLVPMAILSCCCSDAASTARLFVSALRGARKQGVFLDVVSFVSKIYFLLLKKWTSELLERVKLPVQSLPALRKLLLYGSPLQNISGDFGV